MASTTVRPSGRPVPATLSYTATRFLGVADELPLKPVASLAVVPVPRASTVRVWSRARRFSTTAGVASGARAMVGYTVLPAVNRALPVFRKPNQPVYVPAALVVNVP